MAPNKTNSDDPSRVTRTVGFRPDQDRFLNELLGDKGNLSGFIQGLVDLVMQGSVDTRNLLKKQKDQSALARAAAYLEAKEAGLLFEEDVSKAIEKWLTGRRGLRVTRSRIHNGNNLFIADASIEDAQGNVLLSVVCKSSPRPDRLQLALAESMIGAQKTGKPVLTVVPYFLEESAESIEHFKLMKQCVVELKHLSAGLEKLLKNAVT